MIYFWLLGKDNNRRFTGGLLAVFEGYGVLFILKLSGSGGRTRTYNLAVIVDYNVQNVKLL